MGLSLINASNGSGEAVRASVTMIRTPGSVTIAVDFVTNWPTSFYAVTGKLVTSSYGVTTLTNPFVFKGHLSGSSIVIDSPAPGYNDPGNAVSDVVILKPETVWADNIASTLAVSHTDTGALNATAITQVSTSLANSSLRLKPRISVATTTATLTANIGSFNVYELNAQATALTIANPSGTPNDGDVLIIRLKDNGTSQAVSFGTNWADISGVGLLTATVAGKWHVIGSMWNAGASKWHVISVTTGA